MNPLIVFAAAEGEQSPLAFHLVEFCLALVVFGLLYLAMKKFVVPNFEKTFGGGGDLVVADFDRDGKPDIVLADQAAQASYDTLWAGMNRRAFPSLPAPAATDPLAPSFLRLGVLNEASLSADPWSV